MKIYLAGPFFNEEERKNVELTRDILREKKFDVFVPMEHKVEDDQKMPNHIWGKKVFEMDKEAIYNCDIMVAIYYGLYSDSGTAWEVGFAKCLGKQIVIVHVGNQKEKSLMIVNGCSLNLDSIKSLKNLNFNKLSENDFVTKIEHK